MLLRSARTARVASYRVSVLVINAICNAPSRAADLDQLLENFGRIIETAALGETLLSRVEPRGCFRMAGCAGRGDPWSLHCGGLRLVRHQLVVEARLVQEQDGARIVGLRDFLGGVAGGLGIVHQTLPV